jgi:hypothetical protein
MCTRKKKENYLYMYIILWTILVGNFGKGEKEEEKKTPWK